MNTLDPFAKIFDALPTQFGNAQHEAKILAQRDAELEKMLIFIASKYKELEGEGDAYTFRKYQKLYGQIAQCRLELSRRFDDES